MDTNKIKSRLFRSMATQIKSLDKEIEILSYWDVILAELPDNDYLMDVRAHTWSDSVHVIYRPPDSEVANAIRSSVQAVLGVIAKREHSPSSQTPDFVLRLEKEDGSYPYGSYLQVTIYHASLAPGCEIVEKEKTIKVYETVCKDGSLAESGEKVTI